MTEEIFENIEKTDEDDIMEPEPSLDQINLWLELENSINQETFKRKNLFVGLSENIKIILASESISTKLISIGQKYGLTKDQTIALARYTKGLFLDTSEDVEITTLTNFLCRSLDVDAQKGKLIFQDIKNAILIPSFKTTLNINAENLTESTQDKTQNIINLNNPSD